MWETMEAAGRKNIGDEAGERLVLSEVACAAAARGQFTGSPKIRRLANEENAAPPRGSPPL